MKKILILSSFPAGYRVDVFKGLAAKYEVTVLFGASSNENRNADWFVRDKDLEYYVLDTEEGKRKAAHYFRTLKQFDLVLGYDWYQSWALWFELKAWMLKIPYIVNCDGAFIKERNIKDYIKGFFIRHASACLAGGEYAREYFIHYGAKNEKIHSHHFTSLHEKDLIDHTITAAEKKQIRTELGLREEKMILSIGQFIERKGFDILLDAWGNAGVSDAQLVLIGGGNLKESYEKIIREKNISNVVIKDFVPFGSIFQYYQAADIFALATREDIWGLIVNEAMANSTPVLISDKCVAGLELINNGRNGFIISNNDVDEWAEKIKQCIADEKLCYSMAEKGRQTIGDYTIEKTICADHNVIDAILNQE